MLLRFKLNLILLLIIRLILYIIFRRSRRLLYILLIFEGLALILVLGSVSIEGISFMALIILIFRACEARLGLSLVVKIVRYLGRDKIGNLSVNKV